MVEPQMHIILQLRCILFCNDTFVSNEALGRCDISGSLFDKFIVCCIELKKKKIIYIEHIIYVRLYSMATVMFFMLMRNLNERRESKIRFEHIFNLVESRNLLRRKIHG